MKLKNRIINHDGLSELPIFGHCKIAGWKPESIVISWITDNAKKKTEEVLSDDNILGVEIDNTKLRSIVRKYGDAFCFLKPPGRGKWVAQSEWKDGIALAAIREILDHRSVDHDVDRSI